VVNYSELQVNDFKLIMPPAMQQTRKKKRRWETGERASTHKNTIEQFINLKDKQAHSSRLVTKEETPEE